MIRTYAQGQNKEGWFKDCWPAWDRCERLWQKSLGLTQWGPILDHGVNFVIATALKSLGEEGQVVPAAGPVDPGTEVGKWLAWVIGAGSWLFSSTIRSTIKTKLDAAVVEQLEKARVKACTALSSVRVADHLNLTGAVTSLSLGEATHGTHEFYRERAFITRRLIVEKGFAAVAETLGGEFADIFLSALSGPDRQKPLRR